MRTEHPPLCGRDHLSFRSYYFPVKVGDSGLAFCNVVYQSFQCLLLSELFHSLGCILSL